MKPINEKSAHEIGVLLGQLSHTLNIAFLNFAIQGAFAKNTSAANQAAHATAAAMGDGLNKRERDLAIVCHDELCARICAGMSLADAVASARFQEPGKSAFAALSDAVLNKLEAQQ